jgi:hypothetical protein
MKVFHTNSFMVALSRHVKGNTKERTDCFEDAFESTPVVDDDKTAETNFE